MHCTHAYGAEQAIASTRTIFVGPSGVSRRCKFVCAITAVATATLLAAFAQPASAFASAPELRRVSGSSVYEIAAKVAGVTCDSKVGSHSIALASGADWSDALAGSALDRPLLLTTQAVLAAPTRAYLDPCRDHPKAKVIILGGDAAVSVDVEEDLRDMGFRVDRIAGADRYETAHRVARIFAPDELPTVFVASGENYADAVAAAPGVTRETPLILTAPDSLHVQARQFLTAEDRSIGTVTILGGHAAVSEAVESEIRSLGLETRRIAGADRYETAALIARESFAVPGCHPVRDVAVASGTSPYGGLAASAVRGPCQPLLLAPEASDDIPASLLSFGEAWRLTADDLTGAFVTAIGPSNQVPDEALTAVATGSQPEPTAETDEDGSDSSGSAENSEPDGSFVDDGQWGRGFTAQMDDPYLVLFATADDHMLPPPWDDVVPGLFVFCGNDVIVDFWSHVARSWGSGPLIDGQVDHQDPARNGQVPVAYRIGGPHVDLTGGYWWPSDAQNAIVSGEAGADLVTALLSGTGPLAFLWANYDDVKQTILFPVVDGFANAYEHLETHCS